MTFTMQTQGQIDAVDRALSETTRNGRPAKVARLAQTYPTTVADLWEAVTTPDRLGRWFMPVSGELRQGGHYALEGNAEGTIETCEPPRRFSATWEFGGQVSWIEVAVEEAAGGARLELVHTAHVEDEWWEQYGPGATGVGWDLGFLGLGAHLAHPDEERPEMTGWEATDEGRGFITASSERWTEASIALGTPTEQARAAGERTTAFYTGVA